MGYLEFKQRGSVRYVYFVKKGSIQGTPYVIRKYVGKDNGLFSKEQFLIKNQEILNMEELGAREFSWKNAVDLTYSPNLIKVVEEKAIILNTLTELKNANAFIDAEFAKEFIYNSNNIEGSRIPKEKLVELFEKGVTQYSNKNEVVEVDNSIKAFEYVKTKFSLNVSNIKKLYHILTKNMFMDNGKPYPRGLRKIDYLVVGDSKVSKSCEIKKELESLISWNKNNSKKMYPLQRAFDVHLKYEITHPFRDGNGRTGRLIMNKILLQNNYPPIIIYKDNKLAYFNSIQAAREGDRKKYYQFMFEQTEKTYDQMLSALKKL